MLAILYKTLTTSMIQLELAVVFLKIGGGIEKF
jgi:hypothetical protein